MALSVGLLNDRSARAIGEDPHSFLAAMHELQDLVREIVHARQGEDDVITAA
ncbi:hypothetical protein ACFY2W_36065 [Streptomyces sp. NPDC001262]|uniref:hypothetical protein n=1 Tax=Streptomyces sp. NPDC001262 TaxID=3364552 RepID=UPI00369032C7